MPIIHITKTSVERIDKPNEGRIDYFDDVLRGFGVRVSPTSKTYFTMRRVNGKLVRAKIDTVDKITAEKARKQAEAMLAEMGKGNDPNKAKKERARLEEEERARLQEEAAREITVKGLVAEYIERHAKKFKKKSWRADERLLNVEIIPIWGMRNAAAITKRDVTVLLETIVDRGTPAMSNQVLKITRKMFNFAVERDILPNTPFTGVKAVAPTNSRQRTLSESEIKTLWESIDNAAMSDEIRRALKLVLVTAQRPGEVTGMHIRELDGRWWTIPGERAKNRQEHRVYLSDTALDLIGDTTGKGYVFPTPHQAKERPIDAHAMSVAVRRNLEWPLTDNKGKSLIRKDGKLTTENRLHVSKFTPHDLRRTAATFMASMGYMDEIIDAVLNHVKQGVIRTYNRHGYDKEKQQALEAWSRKLVAITTGTESNVIPMRRKTAGEK